MSLETPLTNLEGSLSALSDLADKIRELQESRTEVAIMLVMAAGGSLIVPADMIRKLQSSGPIFLQQECDAQGNLTFTTIGQDRVLN